MKSKAELINTFKEAPKEVQSCFEHLPRLIDAFPLDVCLSYVFARTEAGQNMTLYCGLGKLHRAEKEVTWAAIDVHHMTRADFRAKFETVFGEPVPDAIVETLQKAEKVRDRVMHGKTVSDPETRTAIGNVIGYAKALNIFVSGVAGFKPFGDLRGFKGAGQALDKATTRWILKGMGFPLK